MSHLNIESLTEFKQQDTDENKIIAKHLINMIPQSGDGWIIDVGAGAGDIAAAAFPNRKALLIDTLDYPANGIARHITIKADFLSYAPPLDKPADILLMTHVIQYLDTDVVVLNKAVMAWWAKEIIVVRDIIDADQRYFLDRLLELGVPTNAEEFVWGFLEDYTKKEEVFLEGTIAVDSFTTLAEKLATIIFDAQLKNADILSFSRILQTRLTEPKIIIPQIIERYVLNQ